MRKEQVMILLSISINFGFGQTLWQPPQPVPEKNDCVMTGGDVAISVIYPNPTIYFCLDAVNVLNAAYPGIGHFFYVHEYGHIMLLTSDEMTADIFAATELAKIGGDFFLNAAIKNFLDRYNSGEPINPRYGSMLQRAYRIYLAASQANPNLNLTKDSRWPSAAVSRVRIEATTRKSIKSDLLGRRFDKQQGLASKRIEVVSER